MAVWPPGSLDHGGLSQSPMAASWPVSSSASVGKETGNACPGLSGHLLLGKHLRVKLLDGGVMSVALCEELPHGSPSARAGGARQPPPAFPPRPRRPLQPCSFCPPPPPLGLPCGGTGTGHPSVQFRVPAGPAGGQASPSLPSCRGGRPALAELRGCTPGICLPDEAGAYSRGC